MHGEEFDGRHSEVAQVFDGRRVRKPGIGATQLRGNFGVAHREPADVHLVDDRVRPGHCGRPVVTPVEVVAHDDGFRHELRRVAVVLDRVVATARVAEHRVVQDVRTVEGTRVGIREQLARVEPCAATGLERAVYPKPVPRARAHARHVTVPDVVRRFAERDAGLDAVVVEQAEIDRLGVLGEHREVRSTVVGSRAERSPLSWPDFHPVILPGQAERPAEWRVEWRVESGARPRK